MTPVNPTTNNSFYVVANATTQSDPFITFYSLRDPTSNDYNFPIQKRWINFTSLTAPREWILESFTNASGQLQAIWVLLAAGGTQGVLSLSDDVGTKVFPDGTGNIQIEGQLNEQSGFFATIVADPTDHLLLTNPMSGSRWIVDPLSNAAHPNGTHTTISSAIVSATSGDTILLMPGVYTENPVLKSGVNITAFSGDATIAEVTILGNCSYSGIGPTSLSNISLQTNSNYCLSVTGSSLSQMILNNCSINCSNHTGINYTNSNSDSVISLNFTSLNLNTTGISAWDDSSPGSITCNFCGFGNPGDSTTLSNNSAGMVFLTYCFSTIGFSTSSSGVMTINDSLVAAGTGGTLNIIPLVIDGISGSFTSTITNSSVLSGTASSISVGTGTTIVVTNTNIQGSNAAAITGLGTTRFSGINFNGPASTINSSTQMINPFNGGRYVASAIISGVGTLVAGTVTIADTTITNNDMVILSRTLTNASTTLGELSYSISAGASFTVTSKIIATPGSTQTGDLSSFTYFIIRQV